MLIKKMLRLTLKIVKSGALLFGSCKGVAARGDVGPRLHFTSSPFHDLGGPFSSLARYCVRLTPSVIAFSASITPHVPASCCLDARPWDTQPRSC